MTCLVTGGGSGIGRATALAVAARMPVVIADVDEDGLQRTEDLIRAAAGRAVVAVRCDVRDPADCAAAVKAAADLGGLTDVVSSAGILRRNEPLLDSTPESWRAVLDVNLIGPANLVRAALPNLLDTGGGDIVLVASLAALQGMRGVAAYSASKAGLVGLARSVVADYGSRGVRVNCVCPGPTETPMASTPSGRLLNAAGRAATADEVASVIVWLTDDTSDWVNGTVLPVDAGETAATGRAFALEHPPA
ncbi:MAG TPA: SDR family oxidoreductase [Acidimicrobiia bacterium]|nr:SDR family oxidoreductase [Acidimicrobiia bacterium]